MNRLQRLLLSGVLVGSLLALGIRARTIVVDTQLQKAEAIALGAVFNAKQQRDAFDALEAIARDPQSSATSREYALEALAWLDIQSKTVDLRVVFERLNKDTTLPSQVRGTAKSLLWQVRALETGLPAREREILLRHLAEGRVGEEVIHLGLRRWAALELCARGVMDPEVVSALSLGFGGHATKYLDECRQQKDFVEGRKESDALRAALSIPDHSMSLSFRRLAFDLVAARGDKSLQQEAIMRIGALDSRPGDLILQKHVAETLMGSGWTAAELQKSGIRPDIGKAVAACAAQGKGKP